MPHRSPARFLAPLALVGFAVALAVVIGSSGGNDERPVAPPATVERTARQQEERAPRNRGERRQRRARTYRVKAGDTPSGIAEKTGVSLEELEALNPDLDPQSLNVGDEIRIR